MRAATLESLMAATVSGEAETTLHQERTVVLAVDRGGLSETLLDVAIGLSSRVNASLEILMAATSPAMRPGRFVGRWGPAGEVFRLEVLREMGWESVVRHSRALPNVTCVVVDARSGWGRQGSANRERLLPCPLVVVGERRQVIMKTQREEEHVGTCG